jgi:hypothetical protein
VWCITGASSTGTLWKSDDGGLTWRALDLGDAGSLWNIAVNPKAPMTMYVGARNGIYRSTDATHFVRMEGSPTSRNFEYASLDPQDPSIVYAISFNSGSKGGLYRCYAGGWRRLLAKPQAAAVAIDPANPRRIAVLTRGWTAFDETSADGVWISEDDGATWSQHNDGLRMVSGPAIAFNPDKSGQLILATDGAGFYVTDLGDSTPHGGKVRSVLSPIAAADYDDGPQGFAAPSTARRDALRGLKAGQWAKYTVNVPATGDYDITCQVASKTAAQFHLEFNGVNVTGPVEVKPTGGSTGLTAAHIPHVRLLAGDQYMKVFAEADSMDFASIQMAEH